MHISSLISSANFKPLQLPSKAEPKNEGKHASHLRENALTNKGSDSFAVILETTRQKNSK